MAAKTFSWQLLCLTKSFAKTVCTFYTRRKNLKKIRVQLKVTMKLEGSQAVAGRLYNSLLKSTERLYSGSLLKIWDVFAPLYNLLIMVQL